MKHVQERKTTIKGDRSSRVASGRIPLVNGGDPFGGHASAQASSSIPWCPAVAVAVVTFSLRTAPGDDRHPTKALSRPQQGRTRAEGRRGSIEHRVRCGAATETTPANCKRWSSENPCRYGCPTFSRHGCKLQDRKINNQINQGEVEKNMSTLWRNFEKTKVILKRTLFLKLGTISANFANYFIQ